jgi:hypothetical protein
MKTLRLVLLLLALSSGCTVYYPPASGPRAPPMVAQAPMPMPLPPAPPPVVRPQRLERVVLHQPGQWKCLVSGSVDGASCHTCKNVSKYSALYSIGAFSAYARRGETVSTCPPES